MELVTKFNMLYISITIVLSLLLMVLSLVFKFNFNHRVAIIPIFFLMILLIVRDRGWDLQLYKDIFQSVDNLYIGGWIEPGFQVSIIFLKSIGADFFEFNFCYALVISFLLYKISGKSLTYPLVFVFLFLSLYYFRGPYGQMRQAFAMLMFLYSIRFIENKGHLFFIINAIALTVHSIAILPFFAYFLIKYIRVTKAIYLIVLLTLVIIFTMELPKMIFNSSLLNYSFFMKVRYYINNAHSTGGIFTPVTFKILFITFILLFIYPKFESLSFYDRTVIGVFTVGVIVYGLCSYDLRIADRASRIFVISEILILTKVLDFTDRKVLITSLYTAYGLLFLCLELYMMSQYTIFYSWS